MVEAPRSRAARNVFDVRLHDPRKHTWTSLRTRLDPSETGLRPSALQRSAESRDDRASSPRRSPFVTNDAGHDWIANTNRECNPPTETILPNVTHGIR